TRGTRLPSTPRIPRRRQISASAWRGDLCAAHRRTSHVSARRPGTVAVTPERSRAPRLCPVKPPAARGRLRMKKAVPARCDVGAAVTRLAGELVVAPSSRARSAVLDQLRRRLHASDALLWLCNGVQASCVLHQSGGQTGGVSKVVELE